MRSNMAAAAASDVSSTLRARQSFDWEGFKKRGGRPEEVDQLAQLTTRQVLVDWVERATGYQDVHGSHSCRGDTAKLDRGGVCKPKVSGFSPMIAAAKKLGT